MATLTHSTWWLIVCGLTGVLSTTTSADFTEAIADHRTEIFTDFGGAELELHVVDVYLMSDDENDRLLNLYNLFIQCGAGQWNTGFGGWCLNNDDWPFPVCQWQPSFLTIGGIGPHDEPPTACDFDPACSCDDSIPGVPPTSLIPVFSFANCGVPVQTPNGLGVFIGRFSATTLFTLDGTTLEATWNQGLGTPGNQAGFVVRSIDDLDGDCTPDHPLDDCDGNGVSDDIDIRHNPSLDCNSNGEIDHCEIGFSFDPVMQIHDDVPEDVVGSKGEGGTLAWFEAFGPVSEDRPLTSVGVDFGVPGGPGPVLDRRSATIAIWTDPIGDADPRDAAILASTDIVITDSIRTGLQECRLDPPVVVPAATGFFVGVVMDIPPDAYPAAVDTSGGSIGSWVAFDPAGFNEEGIGSARDLGRLADFGFDWRWMITARVAVEPGINDCDASGRLDECEIASGEIADDNGNGTPDTCEISQGDLNLDGCIDSGDLGLLIALWGLSNPPLGDLNGDGIIGPADLGLLIGNWTPCEP